MATPPMRLLLALLGVAASVLWACSSDGGSGSEDVIASPTTTSPPREARSASEPTLARTAGEPEVVEIPIVVHALGVFDVLPTTATDWPDSLPAIGDDLATLSAISCVIGSDGCGIADITPLAQGDLDVVSLASTLNGGDAEALSAFRTELADLDIGVVGFGESQASAVRPLMLSLDGATVAFHGISMIESEDFAFADDDTAGIAGPAALDLLIEQLELSASSADEVIVSVQWGETDLRAPTAEMTNTAAQLVDAGAGVIVGHGSGFLQRFELVEGAPVVYSLGNAATDSEDPLLRDTAVLRLSVGGIRPEPTCLLAATATVDGPILDDLDKRDCLS